MRDDQEHPFLDPSEDPIDDEFPEFEKADGHSSPMDDFDEADASEEIPLSSSRSSEPFRKTDPASDSFESHPTDKVNLTKVPLELELEVARIHVSLDELQKMEPGYKLPIDVNPRIINLVLQGKSIGKGEIVEIGDVVGVRIIELYR